MTPIRLYFDLVSPETWLALRRRNLRAVHCRQPVRPR